MVSLWYPSSDCGAGHRSYNGVVRGCRAGRATVPRPIARALVRFSARPQAASHTVMCVMCAMAPWVLLLHGVLQLYAPCNHRG